MCNAALVLWRAVRMAQKYVAKRGLRRLTEAIHTGRIRGEGRRQALGLSASADASITWCANFAVKLLAAHPEGWNAEQMYREVERQWRVVETCRTAALTALKAQDDRFTGEIEASCVRALQGFLLFCRENIMPPVKVIEAIVEEGQGPGDDRREQSLIAWLAVLGNEHVDYLGLGDLPWDSVRSLGQGKRQEFFAGAARELQNFAAGREEPAAAEVVVTAVVAGRAQPVSRRTSYGSSAMSSEQFRFAPCDRVDVPSRVAIASPTETGRFGTADPALPTTTTGAVGQAAHPGGLSRSVTACADHRNMSRAATPASADLNGGRTRSLTPAPSRRNSGVALENMYSAANILWRAVSLVKECIDGGNRQPDITWSAGFAKKLFAARITLGNMEQMYCKAQRLFNAVEVRRISVGASPGALDRETSYVKALQAFLRFCADEMMPPLTVGKPLEKKVLQGARERLIEWLQILGAEDGLNLGEMPIVSRSKAKVKFLLGEHRRQTYFGAAAQELEKYGKWLL